jgi:hypothetical protein
MECILAHSIFLVLAENYFVENDSNWFFENEQGDVVMRQKSFYLILMENEQRNVWLIKATIFSLSVMPSMAKKILTNQ